ncbi:hypothetical protein [Jeotgalibacillus marinus]|uniref:Uncharacterized protein n=1 Tax=Jeotgalibacillus marinus TaxID=86667 RepID=A0ABV3Q5C4_9BACL
MEKRLFLWIGLFIFGGMLLQTVIQLDKFSYQLEAVIAITIASVIYAGLVIVKKKSFSFYVGATSVLAIAAVVLIFAAPLLLPTH